MNKIEHTSHAGINFEPNKKLGYYLVGNEIYYNKIQALVYASKKNLKLRWFFNEDIFVKYPWYIEPETSLRELYRQRAQQLRDQYDYIRLELSGGSDSTTVAYSFLLNGIHLDEVIFRYPKQGEKGVTGDAYNTRPENSLSEWEFATKPLLNWIATNYPNVKITVHDYSKDMIAKADTLDESWIFRTRHYLQPGQLARADDTNLLEHNRRLEHTNKMCLLWGVDKLKVFTKDEKFFFYFTDGQASLSASNELITEYSGVTNEFFFWSPDCPELLAKQAHEIKRWFSMPQNYQMQGVLQWPNSNFATRTLYEQLVKRIIYPDYDFHTFQTMKPTNNIYNELDYWFHTNFKDSKLYSAWESGINYLLDNLDPIYIGHTFNKPTDIIIYDSLYYCFGDSTIPALTTQAFKTKELITRQRSSATNSTNKHIINGQLVIY